jgi:hypothetical protein
LETKRSSGMSAVSACEAMTMARSIPCRAMNEPTQRPMSVASSRRLIPRRSRPVSVPLLSRVDGSRFEFQASLDDLALQAGGYVVLEADGIGRLWQVLTLRIAPLDVGDLDPEATGASHIRAAQGDGVVLNGESRPFHDALVRPAAW